MRMIFLSLVILSLSACRLEDHNKMKPSKIPSMDIDPIAEIQKYQEQRQLTYIDNTGESK